MIDYDRILKECFWDYDYSPDELRELAASADEKERAFLFEKILLNSSHLFGDLKIFEDRLLRTLIQEYRVPSFNQDYAFKRKNMAEVYFLNKPVLVNELKWVA